MAAGGGVLRGPENPMYGKPSPNRGMTYSDEVRAKLSEINRARAAEWSQRFSGKNNPMYGHIYTDEERKKISDAVRGEKNGFYGKHHSETTKEILRLNHADQSKPVDMIDLQTGEILHTFTSLHEAARYVATLRTNGSADKSFIQKCASGVYGAAYGFGWQFSERCND